MTDVINLFLLTPTLFSFLLTGKTSLLNILVGDTDPTTGKVSRHLGCRIARLQQHHYKGEQLDPNLTPLVSACTHLFCFVVVTMSILFNCGQW